MARAVYNANSRLPKVDWSEVPINLDTHELGKIVPNPRSCTAVYSPACKARLAHRRMGPISTSRRQIQIRTSLEIADSIRFVEKALLNLLSHHRSSRDFSSANELSRITFNILQTNRRIFVNNIRQTDHLVEPVFDGSIPRPPFFRPPMPRLKMIINACVYQSMIFETTISYFLRDGMGGDFVSNVPQVLNVSVIRVLMTDVESSSNRATVWIFPTVWENF